MKVYLAAPYAARETIREYGQQLTRVGFTVTASWLNETHEIHKGTAGAASDLPDEQVAKHASDDLRDIDGSDLLVTFAANSLDLPDGFGGSGGRHVETGYAIAIGMPVLVVGEPENVFHRLPRVCSIVPNWHEALIELAARLVQKCSDAPRVAVDR